MKEIDGVKYITEEEFDDASAAVIDDVFEFMKEKEVSGRSGSLLIMLMLTEFARLGAELFDKEKIEKDSKRPVTRKKKEEK